jgi:GT2 family glycosyltransferase/glycosyltransferase involved in cell wall biosynthesis
VRSPLQAAGYTALIGHTLPDARLDLDCIAQADAVLIQRDFPAHASYRQVIEKARAQGKRIVFEIDDLLWDIPEDHPAAAKYRHAREPILRAIDDADVVTTTTEPLARRLRLLNPNTHVLPNCLDEQLWHNRLPLPLGERVGVRGDGRLEIVYLGGGTHAPDLEMIAPALLKIGTRFQDRVAFVFFGDVPPNALAALPNVKHLPHQPDYAQFAEQLRAQIWDIAIAPLRDTPFNRCKSAVKFLEYTATGAAVVCSDVAPYRAIVEHGVNGLLARNTNEWVEALTQLIEQADLRQRLAAAAQQTAREHGQLSQHAHLWRDAFASRTVHARSLPAVSVIVLNHNGQSYLDDCLSSLSRLDYPPDKLEIVLADNGSTDASLAWVHDRFPAVHILPFERNLGFCAGYNRAIAECDATHVALLNNDMRVEPDWLLQLVAALQDEADTVCAGSKILSWDGATLDFAGHEFSPLGHASSIGHGSTDQTAHDKQRYLLAASAGAMLIDRQAFIDAGGFDESYFAYYEDLDLGWRLWILGHTVVFAPKAVAYHRHFGTSSRIPAPKIAYLYERNTLSTIIKNYDQPYLDKVLPVALMMRTQHAYLLGQNAGFNMSHARLTPGEPLSAPSSATPSAPQPPEPSDWNIRRFSLLTRARQTVEDIERRRGFRPPEPLFNPALLTDGTPETTINDVLGRPALWHEQAQLAAINDVITRYDAVMLQRAELQRKRKRSDADIFALTRCITLRPWFDSPDYVRAHNTLMAAFGIAALFEGALFKDSTE